MKSWLALTFSFLNLLSSLPDHNSLNPQYYNAVLDGAKALFLSGETTHGKYPAKAIETMSKIIVYAEQQL